MNIAGPGITQAQADAAARAPMFVWSNPSPAQTRVGVAAGVYVNVAPGVVDSPGAEDVVAYTLRVTNEGCPDFSHWGRNTYFQQGPPAHPGVRGIQYRAEEYNIGNRATEAQYEPDPFAARPGKIRTNAVEIAGIADSDPVAHHNTSALAVWAPPQPTAWFETGLALSRVLGAGLTFHKDPGGDVDYVRAFAVAAIHDKSDSAAVVRVAGNHEAVIDLQDAPGMAAFIRGPRTIPTNVLIRNFADLPANLILDCGATTAQQSYFAFADRGALAWSFLRAADASFHIFNHRTGRSALACRAGRVDVDGVLSLNGRPLTISPDGIVRAQA